MNIKLMTSAQFTEFKLCVAHHCIRPDTFCDGTYMKEGKGKTYSCPFYRGGRCTQQNIMELRDKIERK